MKSKKFITIAIIVFTLIVVMTACFSGVEDDKRPAYDVPSMDLFDAEVTAESITVIPNKYYEAHSDGEVLEYKISSGDWQDSPTFDNLLPNTDYTISIRVKEDKNHKASDSDYLYLTTSKKEPQVLPAKINYTQENRTITVEKNDAWEYCFWDDDNYRDANSYTFSEYDNGEKTVKVRIKATNEAKESDAYEFKVYISGYYSGSGTDQDPFLIYTKEHFNSRSTVSSNKKSYLKLMNDLDFANSSIGDCIRVGDNFDGNGHKIVNVKITQAKTGDYIVQNYAGIFTQVHTVKNLTVENVDIQLEAEEWEVNYLVGLIAGGAHIVENCHAQGSIVIDDGYNKRKVCGIGGLVGEMGTTNGDVVVKNSSSDVKITYNSTADTAVALRVGGLFGSSVDLYTQSLKVSESMANIDVDLKGFTSYNYDRYSGVGGLVGDTKEGSIENCYASGTIKASGVSGNLAVGGLTASIYASYESYRSVYPNIKYCYSTVDIDVDGTNQKVIVGGVNPMMHSKTGPKTVDSCLFAGSINITNLQSKSAAGSVYGKDLENVTINNCFHIDGLADYVDVSASTAVDETTIKSVIWQRNTLGLSEDYWKLVEGSYPVLK